MTVFMQGAGAGAAGQGAAAQNAEASRVASDIAAGIAEGARLQSAIDAAAARAQGAAPAAANGQTADSPNTILIPTDAGENIRISVSDKGIMVTQGTKVTNIPINDVIPNGVVQMSWALACSVGALVIGWPIARAIARLIDRKGRDSAAIIPMQRELTSRFEAMERNIDTVALEVERVSEAQRFTSKLLSERAYTAAPHADAAPQAPAMPVAIR